MTRPYNILIICTGNSARSIMAEVIFNHMGAGLFKAYSAGSQPAGQVNPFALAQIAQKGLPIEGLRSKSWDEFVAADAPAMDFVLTVCGNAANEVCPFWPGHPSSAHWGFSDPAAVGGDDAAAKQAAFQTVFGQIEQRLAALMAHPLADLDQAAIKTLMQQMGERPV